MNFLQENRGISLLITLVILSAVLAAAIGIASIFTKEIRTSSFVDNSVFAIMAADAGVERMLYNIRQLDGSTTANFTATLSNGATYETCKNAGDCSGGQFKSVGEFNGIQRALEVSF